MEGTASVKTVDETTHAADSVCETHKEGLNFFCVEDQIPLCSVCRKSWDHASHTVVPENQARKMDSRETGSPLSGRSFCFLCSYESSFPKSKPTDPTSVGYSNTTAGFKGKGEALDGTAKGDTDRLELIEQWVDFNLEEKKEDRQSNARVQNSITWIVLVLFIIQIVGLVTTIFVFMKAKPDLPGTAAASHCCPPGWVRSQGHCYRDPGLEGPWEAGQRHCSLLGASLAVIEDLEKLIGTVPSKGPLNHWVGLLQESEASWRWPDGTAFSNAFEVQGKERCAYLSDGVVKSTDCSVGKKWLCSQKAKRSAGSRSHCGAT
ncbi:C-type lectin domain family 2 member B [Varanus komodoensis]|nr:C-type lectin domain family 2 member B [Varanus komodoensis]